MIDALNGKVWLENKFFRFRSDTRFVNPLDNFC